ncbi:MAG: hypothetical protein ACRD4K_07435, partial [Candidatus Acidiferrales bacterium]
QNITLCVPTNQEGLLTEIVQDQSLNMASFRLVFGDLTNRSAYDQYAVLLNTTPRSIRAFGPRAEAVRGITLLTIKGIALGPGLETGVFSFEWPDKRGFQIGDPWKSRRVDLEIFDIGGQHIELNLAASKDNIQLSQPEINRILTSLHVVAVESSVATSARPTALARCAVGPHLSAKGHNDTNKRTHKGKDRRIRTRTVYFLSAAGGAELVVD